MRSVAEGLRCEERSLTVGSSRSKGEREQAVAAEDDANKKYVGIHHVPPQEPQGSFTGKVDHKCLEEPRSSGGKLARERTVHPVTHITFPPQAMKTPAPVLFHPHPHPHPHHAPRGDAEQRRGISQDSGQCW
ncbi:hypothetical protein E2C01_053084 [Portunus trituberculatus]|uniref:Uncharacterized protein n=1 Tax=Portunus trituberculatus TaxID=210409 RepID=A0A5B7GFH7_PORTR|nr:hypothetical protein [Portunus trituberculatus]